MYLSFLMLGAGFFLFFRSLKNYRLALTIQALPRSKTATAPQGLVEIQGFALKDGEAVQSHQSEKMIFHRTLIQYKRPLIFGANRWKTLAEVERPDTFLLQDESGQVRVKVKGGEALLKNKKIRLWKELSTGESQELLQTFSKPPVPVLSRLFGYIRGVISFAMITPAFFFAFILWIYDRAFFSLLPHYPPTSGDKHYRVVQTWLEDPSPVYVVGSLLAKRTEQENNPSIFGEMVSTSQHPLFLGDGFETQVSERLKSWLLFKFFLSGLFIFCGMYFTFLEFESQVLKQTQSQANMQKIHQEKSRNTNDENGAEIKVAEKASKNPRQLHEECVKNILVSCQFLIDNQKLFILPQQNIDYYQSKISSSPASN